MDRNANAPPNGLTQRDKLAACGCGHVPPHSADPKAPCTRAPWRASYAQRQAPAAAATAWRLAWLSCPRKPPSARICVAAPR